MGMGAVSMCRDFNYVQNHAPDRRTLEILFTDLGVGPWAVMATDGGWSIEATLLDGMRAADGSLRRWLDDFYALLQSSLWDEKNYGDVIESLQRLVRSAAGCEIEDVRGILSGGMWLLGQVDTATAELAHREWSTGDLPLLESYRCRGAMRDATRAAGFLRDPDTANRIRFMQASDPHGWFVERVFEETEIAWRCERILLDDSFDLGFLAGARIGVNLTRHYQTPMREIGGGWGLSWSQQQTEEALVGRRRSCQRARALQGRGEV